MVSIVLGVLVGTVALSTSVSGHRIPAHRGWDRGLVTLLTIAAVISAIADIGSDTAVFAVAALVELLLLANTRYVAEPIDTRSR